MPLLAPFYLIALAFIGIADTLYLSISAYTGIAPTCLLEGCELVLTSPYAKWFGVPLSYIGLVFYIYMLCLAVLLAFEPRSRSLRLGALAYTGVGSAMSLAFIYIQGVLIGAFCQYCLISALLTFLLLGTTLWHYRKTKY